MNYSNVCMKYYVYESRDIVDNILERLLGNYELKVCLIIDKIIKLFNENIILNIIKGDEEFLYKYMNL